MGKRGLCYVEDVLFHNPRGPPHVPNGYGFFPWSMLLTGIASVITRFSPTRHPRSQHGSPLGFPWFSLPALKLRLCARAPQTKEASRSRDLFCKYEPMVTWYNMFCPAVNDKFEGGAGGHSSCRIKPLYSTSISRIHVGKRSGETVMARLGFRLW